MMNTLRSWWLLLAAAVSLAFQQPLSTPAVVARFDVQAGAPFVRATVPIAPGTRWNAARCPWTVNAPDGSHLITQWEKVATWADGSVRIAEVLARGEGTLAPGTYSIEATSQNDVRATPAAWARAWLAAPPAIEIDGNTVGVKWSSIDHRFGSVAITKRFFGPRVFGWVTWFDGADVVVLELVLHNAHTASPDFFFDELALRAPSGPLYAESAWPEPGISTRLSGTLELVGPRADAKAHALVQRGSSTWSLVLHDGTQAQLARAIADGAGWGVSDAWTSVDAFGAVALRLPNLEYRSNVLAAAQRNEWNVMRSALAAGSPFGLTSGGVGRSDWLHPYNPKDGGTTGGGARHQWHGVDLVATGEPAGRSTMQARLAAIMDRHAAGALKPNGMPIALEEMLDASGKPRGNWVSSAADARFDGKTDGAFGWTSLETVNAGARTPPELALFKQRIAGAGNAAAFEPIDWQHIDRAIQDAEALVQLDHSPLAAWWLRLQAEQWRMSVFSKNRLGGELAAARARPAWGTYFGRAHGHGMRLAAMSYAISDVAWRARWKTTVEQCLELFAQCQMSNGLFKRDEASKALKSAPFNEQWALTKGTEEALLAFGVLGLARSTQTDENIQARTVESVDRWTRDGLWKYLWNQGRTGSSPTDYVAIAPRGAAATLDPSVALRLNQDGEEVASPLGCAMLLRAIAGQPFALEQLAAARAHCGGNASPLAWMRNQTPYKLKLDDVAPLHAAFELQP